MTAINGVMIYRELVDPPPVLLSWLDDRGQLFNVLDDKQIERLYVDNDIPRDADITPLIMESTKGFSIFDETGKWHSSYSRLDTAMRAQAKAKMVIIPELELEEEMDLESETPEQTEMEIALQARIAELEDEAEENDGTDESA